MVIDTDDDDNDDGVNDPRFGRSGAARSMSSVNPCHEPNERSLNVKPLLRVFSTTFVLLHICPIPPSQS